MEKSTDNRTVHSREEMGSESRDVQSYYEHEIGTKQFYKRDGGGELPPFYVQKPIDSDAEVIASEHMVGVASEGDRIVGRDDFTDEIEGLSAYDARRKLSQDWSENKSYGAAIVMAEDGIAFRSVEDSQYRVVMLSADGTHTLGSERTPTGAVRPKGDTIFAIVDVDTAERLHEKTGYNGLREIEDELLSNDTPYATVLITEKQAKAMAKNRGETEDSDQTSEQDTVALAGAGGLSGDDIRPKDGEYDTPLMPYIDRSSRDDIRPTDHKFTYAEGEVGPENGTFWQRTISRASKYTTRARDAATVKALMLRNKINRDPKRRDGETDEAYERRQKRTAAAIALGGVGVLAAIGLTQWAHENDGIINALQNYNPDFPPELDGHLPDVDLPDVDLPSTIDLDPDFSIPNIDLDPDPELGVPFINPDFTPSPMPDLPPAPDVDVPTMPPVDTPDVPPVPDGGEPAGDILPDGIDFTPEARNITQGEGWYDTFDQMGITDPEVKDALLDDTELMNDLQGLNVAYPDDNLFGDWGVDMTPSGTMPEPALDLIADSYEDIVGSGAVTEQPGVDEAVESLTGTPANVIEPGEGWISTFNETLTQLGVTDPNQQWAMLNNSALMNELQDMGIAYYDEQLLDRWGSPWGIYMTESGTLPYEAKEVLVRYADPSAYDLAR